MFTAEMNENNQHFSYCFLIYQSMANKEQEQ